MRDERSDLFQVPCALGKKLQRPHSAQLSSFPQEGRHQQVQPIPAQTPRALNRIQPGVPSPTFPRSCRKHQRAHWGPAHSKQVLVGQLQGGQGLGLQHGVQVDVAIGPCAQEEVPGWEVGRKARRADECWVASTATPSCQTSRLSAPGKPPRTPNLGSSVRGPTTSPGYQSSQGETWATDCRAFEQFHGEALWGSLPLPVAGGGPPGRAFPTCGRGSSSQSRQAPHGGRRRTGPGPAGTQSWASA